MEPVQEDTDNPQAILQQAFDAAYHRHNWSEANDLCVRVLKVAPERPDALTLWGMVQGKLGQAQNAAKAYQQAIRCAPFYTDAYFRLGDLAYQHHQLDLAVTLFKQTLILRPDWGSVYPVLAQAAAKQNQTDLAEQIHRCHLVLAGKTVTTSVSLDREIYLTQGNRLYGEKCYDEAVAVYHTALAIDPTFSEVYYNLGQIKRIQGDWQSSLRYYHYAASTRPSWGHAYIHLGDACRELGDPVRAIAYYRLVLTLTPDIAEIYSNLGTSIQGSGGDLSVAEQCFRYAIRLNPRLEGAYISLAAVLLDQYRPMEAVACYEEVLAFNPESVFAQFNRGLVLLMCGDYPRGFPGYEWRFKSGQLDPPNYRSPRWQGEDPRGKTIFIVYEQGFGDALQFVRYADVLADMGAKVVVESRPPLRSLFEKIKTIDHIVCPGDLLPPVDFHISLMSIPMVLGTTTANTPNKVPYLKIDPQRLSAWYPKVAPYAHQLKVGLRWSGSPTNKTNARRSIPFRYLAELVEIPNIAFFSLQKGYASEESLVRPDGMTFLDYTERFEDFEDTGALIDQLDLVITICTSIAHLSGALAKPTWVLLPLIPPDWRWHLGQEESPWYPNVRIFRQNRAGDWAGVIAKVKSALGQFASTQGRG